jgi:murein DD-endopeptidase MepM/ murein hydrolase activator NlpD
MRTSPTLRMLPVLTLLAAGASVLPQTAASGATAQPRRLFPIRACSVTYGHSHHDYAATDIFAPRGCKVVSPVKGRVDEVSTADHWSSRTNHGADRGGISFSIVGDDGVRYYGSHLGTLTVRAGQRVLPGNVVGTVGNTGSARGTATHLHFGISWPTRAGIWWVRRGEVYPWSYLDAWRARTDKSPVAAVAAEHRRQGDVPACRADC